MTITIRKANAQRRRQLAEKRGAGHVRGESVFGGHSGSDSGVGIGEFINENPTPEMAVITAETCGKLLDELGDEVLVSVALQKMEGFTNEEIAEKMECAVRTVERKLERIRQRWQRAADSLFPD